MASPEQIVGGRLWGMTAGLPLGKRGPLILQPGALGSPALIRTTALRPRGKALHPITAAPVGGEPVGAPPPRALAILIRTRALADILTAIEAINTLTIPIPTAKGLTVSSKTIRAVRPKAIIPATIAVGTSPRWTATRWTAAWETARARPIFPLTAAEGTAPLEAPLA